METLNQVDWLIITVLVIVVVFAIVFLLAWRQGKRDYINSLPNLLIEVGNTYLCNIGIVHTVKLISFNDKHVVFKVTIFNNQDIESLHIVQKLPITAFRQGYVLINRAMYNINNN